MSNKALVVHAAKWLCLAMAQHTICLHPTDCFQRSLKSWTLLGAVQGHPSEAIVFEGRVWQSRGPPGTQALAAVQQSGSATGAVGGES
jgi:hypothetical protein